LFKGFFVTFRKGIGGKGNLFCKHRKDGEVMPKEESNVSRMPELVSFDSTFSARSKLLILQTRYKDTLEKFGFEPQHFPDVTMTITLKMAKALIAHLQENVEAMEAGRDHPSSRRFM
jgi:hypothetical protein